MSVTVKDCLGLPTLSLGHVIAGDKGLNNIINLVDVIEFVLEDDVIATPNTLFITAFYAVKDDADAQCRELFTYKTLGASAVVLFYQGLVVQSVDPRVIQTANELNLPIIGIPGNNLGLHYCDVIEEVMEAILIDRRENQKVLDNTLNMISQLSPEKQNLTSLLQFAASFSKSTLFLCDSNLRQLACEHWPRKNSKVSLQDIIPLFDYPEFSNNMNTVRQSPGGAICHMKAFITKNDIKLVLYAYSQNDVLNSSLMDQIAETIRVFISIWDYNLDFSKRNSIITLILEGNNQLAMQLAKDYRINLAEYSTILLLDNPQHINSPNFIKNCENRLKDYFPKSSLLIDSLRDCAIMLVNATGEYDTKIEDLDFSNKFSCQFSIAGKVFNPLNLKKFYSNYYNSKENLKLIFPNERNFSVEQIDFANYCTYIAKTNALLKEYYLSIIKPLLSKKNLEILNTLSCYLLDYNSEIKRVSEKLYIHRNTVQNRLQKAQELTGYKLGSLPDDYYLYTALALNRIGTFKI